MRKGGRREEGKDTEKRKIDARFFLHDAAEVGIAVFGDAYIRASSFESLLRVALYLSIVSNIFGFFVVTCPPESREDRPLLRRRSVHYSSPSPLLPPFLLERTFCCFFRTDGRFLCGSRSVGSPASRRSTHCASATGGSGGCAISKERAHFKRAQLCEDGAIRGPLAMASQPAQSRRNV